jgi:hypothetical protein
MLTVLSLAVAVAALPLVAFFVTPKARRRGAFQLLPWLSGAALTAVVVFVLLVNFGVVSP